MSTLVVKCGGTGAVEPYPVCADVAALVREGRRVVLVHGGSADIDSLAARLGVPIRRLTSPDGFRARHTDDRVLEVVVLALCGAAKPRLVAGLAAHGVSAVGLTGLDGGLLRARRKDVHRAVVDGRVVAVRGGHSGLLTAVRGELLTELLDAGHVPVVSPPALAEDGRPVNMDADRVAAAVAGVLAADALVLLTGAPGVLADPADESSILPVVRLGASSTVPSAVGGMAVKLAAARAALAAGVPTVVIADCRRPAPVRAALTGHGTTVVADTDKAGVVG